MGRGTSDQLQDRDTAILYTDWCPGVLVLTLSAVSGQYYELCQHNVVMGSAACGADQLGCVMTGAQLTRQARAGVGKGWS